MQDNPVAPVIERCKKLIADHYGDRLVGILLYGSMARGDAAPESDIDLLVLLKGRFDHFQELEVLVDLLNPQQITSDHYISARPAAIEDFEVGAIQLYRNAKREGVRA